MAAQQPKANKLSIYLIKSEYQELEDIIESEELVIEIPNIGHFVFDESHSHQPDWVKDFFGSRLDDKINIFVSSAKGLLIVPITRDRHTVHFGIAFGVGRHLLKEGVVEENFGLKVVLNSVDLKSFRSIDKTTLGSVAKHSHEQMSRDVAPAEFGIDIEQDLISSVTGKSRDDKLGKTITGKDALSASVKVDVTNVIEFLTHCLERYKSTDYKQNFDWIDQIKEVRSVQTEALLNDALVKRLNDGNLNKVWMAVPEVINWSDVSGFRYGRPKRSDLCDDLDMQEFLGTLNKVPVTIDILKGQNVYLISAATDNVSLRWSAFRCTYAEIEWNGQLHLLNNGKWYAIAKDFTEQVTSEFTNTPESTIELPGCDGNDEGAYNIVAAKSLTGSCCMDSKLIVHGGGLSRIEFCDVYTADKRMVHVKRYGNSSVLSHLFSQGVVSGELFVSDVEFRRKLNAELPAENKLPDPIGRPNTAEHEVVYGIISNVEGPLDIPFFSKVSLRNARRRLTSFGYRVTLKKIQRNAVSPA